MEIKDQVTGTEEEVEATDSVEVGAESTTDADDPTPESAEPTIEDYTPNYGFKVLDEDRQIDERFHSMIKDKESEEAVRDIMERAYGLDSVKLDRQKLRDENTNLQERATQYDTVANDLQNVGRYAQNKDFGNFFQAMNVNKEDVYAWVLEEAKLQELSQQDPQAYDRHMRQTTVQDQNYRLQQQNDMLVQQQQQFKSNQLQTDMQMSMTTPEVSQAVEQFDTRMGRAGAFREEIINRGRMHYAQTGVDRSPSDIINEMVGMYGFGQGQVAAPTPQFTQPQPRPRREVETMPNVSGRGTSPVKQIPKSIADIRRLGNEMNM